MSRLTSVPFSTVTIFPCTSPPSINVVIVGITAELEVNMTLTGSMDVNFTSPSMGVLNARVEQISSSSIGFGVSYRKD